MSPTGAWYLLWHPSRPSEPQLYQAMSERHARNMSELPKDDQLECVLTGDRPDMLTIVSLMEGDATLALKAIAHWPETDPAAKNTARALVCFKYAFGRSYKKFEGMALSDIVRSAKAVQENLIPLGESEEVIDEPDSIDEEAERENETLRGDDTEGDPGGGGDTRVRLGRTSWSNEVRPEPKAKRNTAMEALGDPRDPDIAEKKARLRGRGVS